MKISILFHNDDDNDGDDDDEDYYDDDDDKNALCLCTGRWEKGQSTEFMFFIQNSFSKHLNLTL